MKRLTATILVTALLLAGQVPTTAQDTPVITAGEAKNYVGREAKVCGKVAGATHSLAAGELCR